MQRFSQRDKLWAKEKLGTCNYTIGSHGCFISSLGMLSYIPPVIVNERFLELGGYKNGCSVDSEAAARILRLQYDGKTTVKPDFPCIAETHDMDNDSTYEKEQHFFVFLPLGGGDYMIDPWEKADVIDMKPLKYNIVSYRLFHERDLKGVGKWWSGERPDDVALRHEAFSSFASQFEEHLKREYHIDKINDLLNG